MDEQVTQELLTSLANRLEEAPGQRLIPVTAANGALIGVTTLRALARLAEGTTAPVTAADAARPCRLSVSTGQLLREVAYLFAETGLTSAPVTDPVTGEVTGVITLPNLLHARLHDLTEENHRERFIPRPPVTAPVEPSLVAEHSPVTGAAR
jgi:CBS domain-containing protein